MENWLMAIVTGVFLGLLIGVKIARDSSARQPVRGGAFARLFHYLACAGLTGMLPFIITGIAVGLPFLTLFGTALALGFLACTGLFLLVYAGFEARTGSAPAA